MLFDIIIPRAGDSVDSCQLARWHITDKATVHRGELILTLETDKVSCDIEAEFTGVLLHQIEEGSITKTGGLVGHIEHDGSQINDVIRELKQNQKLKRELSGTRGFIVYTWKIIQYVLMFLGIRYLIEYFIT